MAVAAVFSSTAALIHANQQCGSAAATAAAADSVLHQLLLCSLQALRSILGF
jgi:hypothetical protein